MNKPAMIVTSIGNARERYEAMRKGKPIPPRAGAKSELSEEVRELFIDTLARKAAELYRQQKEEGMI